MRSHLTYHASKMTLCHSHRFWLKVYDTWKKHTLCGSVLQLAVNCPAMSESELWTIYIPDNEPLRASCQSKLQPVSSARAWPSASKPLPPIAFGDVPNKWPQWGLTQLWTTQPHVANWDHTPQGTNSSKLIQWTHLFLINKKALMCGNMLHYSTYACLWDRNISFVWASF